MFKFKFFLYIFSIFILISSCALAKVHDDYKQEDYERAISGDKNLAGAYLDGACFKGMDMSGVDFTKAELDEVDFSGANLTNAIFIKADLESANLQGANIEGAIFDGAELEYATWVDGKVCGEGSIGDCW